MHLQGRLDERGATQQRPLSHHRIADVVGNIRRGLGRRERTEGCVGGVAALEATAYRQHVPGRHVGVQAGQRSVGLRGLQLVFGPAGDVGRIPAVLRRLLEKQAALDDRPACFQARLDRADALDVRHREALGPKLWEECC